MLLAFKLWAAASLSDVWPNGRVVRMPAAPARFPWLIVLIVGSMVTLGTVLTSGVNQDARYVLGGLDAGWSPFEVWVHRPLAFRLLMAPLSELPPHPAAEAAIRLVMVLVAAGAAALLTRGLRDHSQRPKLIGGAVGAALIWAPGWDFAEPEWWATVLSVAALGLALRDEPRHALSVRLSHFAFAPALLTVAFLLKLTTGFTVAVTLGVLLWYRRTRAIAIAARTIAASALAFVIAVLVSPPELGWLTNMSTLNPPPSWDRVPDLVEGFANLALVTPITMVALAVLIVIAPQRPWLAGGLVLAAVALAAPFVVQQQNFLYHLAALPVLCAGFVAAAADRGPVLRVAAVAGVGSAVGGAVLWLFPEGLRDAHWLWAAAAMVLVVLVAVLAGRIPWRWPTPQWFAVLALLPLLIPVLPQTAYSYSVGHRETTNWDNRQLARPLDLGIEPEVPVLYLAFDAAYRMPNPSTCQYISPTWLQRAADRPAVVETSAYAANLACLANTEARFAIVETDWFVLEDLQPRVRETVAAHFDCVHPVAAADGFIACPRR